MSDDYKVVSYMTDKRETFTSADAAEDLRKITDKLSLSGLKFTTKVCIAIVACQLIRTTGKIIIARNNR